MPTSVTLDQSYNLMGPSGSLEVAIQIEIFLNLCATVRLQQITFRHHSNACYSEPGLFHGVRLFQGVRTSPHKHPRKQ